ncbi:unnamed protein product [Peniophora sp. CBMAI 1063]|nr:unnamed protein product [Peniophora sp. CBMAI 1063]
MAKPSLPHTSSPQTTRSQSTEYPATDKKPEPRRSLPLSSSAPKSDSSPSSEPGTAVEDRFQASPPPIPPVDVTDESNAPFDALVKATARPIPVYQGDRTPTSKRSRPRSTHFVEAPSYWGGVQTAQTPYTPRYSPRSLHPGYTLSTPQPSLLPNLFMPQAWPASSPGQGGTGYHGVYQNPAFAQPHSANHGVHYANSLSLQGVPPPALAAYTPPPPSYWPYPPPVYPSPRGSPNGGWHANGQYSPSPADGGRGGQTWR